MKGLILSGGKGTLGSNCINPEPSLMVNVPNQPCQRDEPADYRLEPYGSLPSKWSRHDG